jgi:hypothetical protein
MKQLVLIFLTLALLGSCGDKNEQKNTTPTTEDNITPIENSSVEIRLSNNSFYEYSNVQLTTSAQDQTVNFGTLKAGETSAYRTFNQAYGTATVQLEIEGKTYNSTANFATEQALEAGRYTYELKVDPTDANAQVNVDLKRD